MVWMSRVVLVGNPFFIYTFKKKKIPSFSFLTFVCKKLLDYKFFDIFSTLLGGNIFYVLLIYTAISSHLIIQAAQII